MLAQKAPILWNSQSLTFHFAIFWGPFLLRCRGVFILISLLLGSLVRNNESYILLCFISFSHLIWLPKLSVSLFLSNSVADKNKKDKTPRLSSSFDSDVKIIVKLLRYASGLILLFIANRISAKVFEFSCIADLHWTTNDCGTKAVFSTFRKSKQHINKLNVRHIYSDQTINFGYRARRLIIKVINLYHYLSVLCCSALLWFGSWPSWSNFEALLSILWPFL